MSTILFRGARSLGLSLAFWLALPALLVLAAAMTLVFAPSALAQDPASRCVDERGCDVSSGNADSSDEAGQRLSLFLRCKLYGGDNCPRARTTREIRSPADAANDAGVLAYNAQHWTSAIELFKQAIAANPNEQAYRRNLANAEGGLQDAQARSANAQANLKAQQREAAAAHHMQQSIEGFTQTFNATRPTAELDFDHGISGTASNAATSKTAVASAAVGGRNVASGLPQAWEDAIAGAYRDAPPGVIERVRRGFQAIQVKDQKVARAWFGDALFLDPGNRRLEALIASVDAQPPSKPAAQVAGLQLPDAGDIWFAFPGLAPAKPPSEPPAQAAGLQLPSDEDVLLLFPGEMPPDPDDGPFGPNRFRPPVVGSDSEAPGGDASLAFTGYSDTYCPTGSPGQSMRCYVPHWAKKK